MAASVIDSSAAGLPDLPDPANPRGHVPKGGVHHRTLELGAQTKEVTLSRPWVVIDALIITTRGSHALHGLLGVVRHPGMDRTLVCFDARDPAGDLFRRVRDVPGHLGFLFASAVAAAHNSSLVLVEYSPKPRSLNARTQPRRPFTWIAVQPAYLA